jgi:hypothetical protein
MRMSRLSRWLLSAALVAAVGAPINNAQVAYSTTGDEWEWGALEWEWADINPEKGLTSGATTVGGQEESTFSALSGREEKAEWEWA